MALKRAILLFCFGYDTYEERSKVREKGPIPYKAGEDALHIAIATVHGIDYLLTWNCRHIANAEMIKGIALLCSEQGYEVPVISTPEEFMGRACTQTKSFPLSIFLTSYNIPYVMLDRQGGNGFNVV